jgi:hypothetical protein
MNFLFYKGVDPLAVFAFAFAFAFVFVLVLVLALVPHSARVWPSCLWG